VGVTESQEKPISEIQIQAVNKDRTFRLSEAKGKYVVLHFLLKNDCPNCVSYTQDYARNLTDATDVVHIFLKPDEEAVIKNWISHFKMDDPEKEPTIYRDPGAQLAKRFHIPYGYYYYGETIHYPSLVILNREGKEVFRHVGRSSRDRILYPQFVNKMAEIRKREKR
jgi:peroxiredoxin Q/BCP